MKVAIANSAFVATAELGVRSVTKFKSTTSTEPEV